MAARWKEFDFSYQWDAQGTTVGYRPIIPVELRSDSGSIRVNALIDSGCDCTMLEASLAEALSIKQFSNSVSVGGVTGERRDAFTHDVSVTVDGFTPFMTDATFVPSLPYACLLGQRRFFDLFEVRFEKHRQKFFIRPA
ncbi:MAG: retroviral-like aspartic protease [Patescibacteria group bacterium]|nr:retropepsin-like domain-containing protein [Patescibacteria group bacterium]MDE1965656.1 retroviral-like aspartic protease [Patescibacteria group bacterium]